MKPNYINSYPELQSAMNDNVFEQDLSKLNNLYHQIYWNHPQQQLEFENLVNVIKNAVVNRPVSLKQRDAEKNNNRERKWFLSNEITGMSLYVDRFCGNIKDLSERLDYFEKLGVNFLHLMPLFQSPAGESDGGYAVSDFRAVDEKFGSLDDLKKLQEHMQEKGMYLMLDIVMNHTSHLHEWAMKAKNGIKKYQDYFYFYDDRSIPDEFEKTMPDVFPEAAPGSFTYVKECNKWVMTVFHNYQWDLNFTNPAVLVEMVDNVLFYANLGVDILRIDAPAFIWKQTGTTCQNLPMAHTILQLVKECVSIAAPGMALLGEAIVAPAEIMKYFGTGDKEAQECDFAYNATHMALQWDALATGDVKVMLAAQHELLKKPFNTSWITYTRCHDDIGLGYEDYMIKNAGYDPVEHRKFLMNYFTGKYESSYATGSLFSVNEKTGDARISGSLASLCGLEKALEEENKTEIEKAIQKILLMQAHSFFLGGIPMIFYGDETGTVNDYSYMKDPGKSYDNRWMHRPVIDWEKNKQIEITGTTEQIIFSNTKKLIELRKQLSVIEDKKNLTWLNSRNKQVAAYLRAWDDERVYCLFNFSDQIQKVSMFVFKENGMSPEKLYDHWNGVTFVIKNNNEYFELPPYSFFILEPA